MSKRFLDYEELFPHYFLRAADHDETWKLDDGRVVKRCMIELSETEVAEYEYMMKAFDSWQKKFRKHYDAWVVERRAEKGKAEPAKFRR